MPESKDPEDVCSHECRSEAFPRKILSNQNCTMAEPIWSLLLSVSTNTAELKETM